MLQIFLDGWAQLSQVSSQVTVVCREPMQLKRKNLGRLRVGIPKWAHGCDACGRGGAGRSINSWVMGE